MNPPSPSCSDERLLCLLQTEQEIDLNPSSADHIAECPHCQARLEQLAAEPTEWLDARSSLQGGNECGAAVNQFFLNDHPPQEGGRWQMRQTVWTDSMARSLLSDPCHPEMLGRIGRYDVERLIGSGGMGVVFKAYDTELNRPVAVKLLAPYLASSGSAKKRFAREARAAAAVVDEHVVAIHNVESGDDSENAPFLVMKYIAGGSLQHRLDRDGPLELCEILRIGTQTAKGLAAAHAQGLIHRDVKPSNILLDEGVERALLTDFGLARAEHDASLTRSGFHPGTPHYMSPEQVRGEAIDNRSDLFSLGCVLYALCTGHPPFRSETSYAVLRRIADDSPRPIREVNSSIPEWLETIVFRLLEKSRDDRYQSADEVAELLECCLAHVQRPTDAALPKSVQRQTAPRRSFSLSNRYGVLTMLALTCFGLLAGLLAHATNPPDIAGKWSGEGWGTIMLKEQNGGAYLGTFQNADRKTSGTISLKWSRIERRFNGTWQEGTGGHGRLSIRLDGNDILGAVTARTSTIDDQPGVADEKGVSAAKPKLADLRWVRTTLAEEGADDAHAASDGAANPLLRSHKEFFDRLEGEWLITKSVDEEGLDGLAEFDDQHATISVEGKLLTVRGKVKGRPFEMALELKLMKSETPQAVDVVIDPNSTESPRIQLGIIECEKDKMRLCITCNASTELPGRPRYFSAGASTWLFEARRIPTAVPELVNAKNARRFQFKLEHVNVHVVDTPVEFRVRLRDDEKLEPIGVWGDPATDTLTIVAKSDEEGAIRRVVAKMEALAAMTVTLESEREHLEDERRKRVRDIAFLELELVEVRKIANVKKEEAIHLRLEPLREELATIDEKLEVLSRRITEQQSANKTDDDPSATDIRTIEQMFASGEQLSGHNSALITELLVGSAQRREVHHADGKKSQCWFLSSAKEAGRLHPDSFEIRVSEQAESALEELGIVDLPAFFVGKTVSVRGRVTRHEARGGKKILARPSSWFYQVTLHSLDQLIKPEILGPGPEADSGQTSSDKQPTPESLRPLVGKKWVQTSQTINGDVTDGPEGAFMVVTSDGLMQSHVRNGSGVDYDTKIVTERFVRFSWNKRVTQFEISRFGDWSEVQKGIAILDGNRLVLCLAQINQPRPTVFATDDQPGAGHILWEYECDEAVTDVDLSSVLTVKQLIANGMQLSNPNRDPTTVRFRVQDVTRGNVLHPNGKTTEHWVLRSAKDTGELNPDALRVLISLDAEAAFKKRGISDIPAHFRGKTVTVRGQVSQSVTAPWGQPDIFTFGITLTSPDQVIPGDVDVDPALGSENSQQNGNQSGSGLARSVALPTFCGTDIRQWFTRYRQCVPEEDPAPLGACERAIRILCEHPNNASIVLQELETRFNDVKNELDPETLDQAAATIMKFAGRRHQKQAIGYLFKIADIRLVPQNVNDIGKLDEGIKPYPMGEAIRSIARWDDELAKQLGDEMTTSSRRIVGAWLALYSWDGHEEKMIERWRRENSVTLRAAFSKGASDPNPVARKYVSMLLEAVSPEEPRVEKSTRSLLPGVIRKFNQEQSEDAIGKTQPLLTDDELIAAVRSMQWKLRDLDISEAEYRLLREAVEAGYLPNNWRIESRNEFRVSDGRHGKRWTVQLNLTRKDGTNRTDICRNRYISIESDSTDEAAPIPEGNVSIFDWVARLNKPDLAIYLPLPEAPITEQEIIAALTDLVDKEQTIDFAPQRATLQEIIDTRSLPKKAEFTLFRPKRHKGFVSRWANTRMGFETRKWSFRLVYPYREGEKEMVTVAILGFRQINSRPVDHVADDEIRWGAPAADGLQLGVAIEKIAANAPKDEKDAPSVLEVTYTPHFYFRNLQTTENTLVRFPPYFHHYDIIGSTPTGEELPTKQWRVPAPVFGPFRPDQLLFGESRIYKRASSVVIGNYETKSFEDSQFPGSPSAPAHAINAPLNTPIRVRFSVSHPLLPDAEPLLSGEVRLPSLKASGKPKAGVGQDVPEAKPDDQGILWSKRTVDDWQAGIRVVKRPTHESPKLVVQPVLRNVSDRERTVNLSICGRGKLSYDILTDNRLRSDISGGSRIEDHTAKANEILQAERWRATFDFTGLEPGNYTLRLGSPFSIPVEGHVGQRTSIPLDLTQPIHIAKPTAGAAYANLPIRWGKPVSGLRVGILFSGVTNNEVKTFMHGDLGRAELFVQNVTQRDIPCQFDLPHPEDGWGINIEDKDGTHIGLNVIRTSIPSMPRPHRAELTPGEIQPLTGKLPKFVEDSQDVSETDRVQFQIDSSDPEKSQYGRPPYIYGLPNGRYTLSSYVNLRRADMPNANISVTTGELPFRVGDPKAS